MIRRIKVNNKEEVFQLYKDFILDMSQYDEDDCNMDDEVRGWIDHAVMDDKSEIFLCEDKEHILGFTRVQHKQREENGTIDYTKLSDLFVIPEARRKGIASQLISVVKQWAKQEKTSEIVLNVYEKNETARALYETNGFQLNCRISLGRIRMVMIL